MQIETEKRTFEIMFSIHVLNAMSKNKITVDEIKDALDQADDQLYELNDTEAIVHCTKNSVTLILSILGDTMTIKMAIRNMPIY